MDDFYRIPKSLCYFMMRHPPLQGKVTSNQSPDTRLTESERREKTRRNSRSPMIEKSPLIPEVKLECLSDDELGAEVQSKSKRNIRSENRERMRNKAAEQSLDQTKRKREARKRRRKFTSDEDEVDLDDVALDEREKYVGKDDKPKEKQPITFECTTCERTFSRRRQYKAHMVKHSALKPFKCDDCDKTFKRKSELNSHRQLHSGIKYTCDECNFVTTTKMSVRTHVRRVHQRDLRYKCGECYKVFMSNSELKDHKTSHLGTKSFICEICGKAFLQKSYLASHKRSVHGIIQKILKKEHHCDICNKNFASEYILKNHAGVHSRKFLCTHCGKECATNYGLQLHSRLHTGERPYQCNMCNKSFVRSNALAVHKLTHTGERPYVCDLCGKSFTQRTTMMIHRRKHPGSHPPPPPTILSKRDGNVD